MEVSGRLAMAIMGAAMGGTELNAFWEASSFFTAFLSNILLFTLASQIGEYVFDPGIDGHHDRFIFHITEPPVYVDKKILH